jgi:predicted RNase H-like HicB family nuclease
MYVVVIEHDPENGSYGATSPDVGDHVVGIGKSPDEAVERFRNALEGYFAFLRDEGQPLPMPRHTVTTVAL